MKKICKLHKHERDHKTCDLHKARVDEGKSPEDKRAARGSRSTERTKFMDEKLGHKEEGQKGINRTAHPGMSWSEAGSAARMSNKMPGSKTFKEMAHGRASKVLGEMKAMPKPNLGKSCDFHKAEFAKHACYLHKSEEESVPETNEREGMHDPEDHDDCPYCAENEDNRTDNCQYCQDLDAVENANGTAGMEDTCPYCQDVNAEQAGGEEEDCPYCEDETVEQANPGLSSDDVLPDSDGPDNCPECQKMYGEASENTPAQSGQEPPKTQGHETAEEVLDMLDQQPGQGTPPAEEAQKIDNTELPQGDAMEEGTSVPENFGDAQKGDISDEEAAFGGQQDQPDMASVMQGGLDDHANEQKRQQVLDMVGQTLAGFKANKASLEATKEQNMPLYQSCIQMLKSMISLCELLGLKPQMQAGQPGQEMPPEQAAPAAPPPAPPGGGASPAEGQPDPKAAG